MHCIIMGVKVKRAAASSIGRDWITPAQIASFDIE